MVARCRSRSLQAVLQGLRSVECSRSRVSLEGPPALVKSAELRLEEISRAIREATGRETTVTLSVCEPPREDHPPPVEASNTPPTRAAPRTLPASSMSDHPLVRQAAELLNARLIRVEHRETTDG